MLIGTTDTTVFEIDPSHTSNTVVVVVGHYATGFIEIVQQAKADIDRLAQAVEEFAKENDEDEWQEAHCERVPWLRQDDATVPLDCVKARPEQKHSTYG